MKNQILEQKIKKKNKGDKDDLNFENESESSEYFEDEEEEEEDEDDILRYEGILYKLVDGKMRELYFRLVHKDLYFFRNKDDNHHKGMHNLSGLFLQKKKLLILKELIIIHLV